MSLKICITGANRGIGLGLVQHYLQAGHDVWALVREPEKAHDLQACARDYRSRLQIIKADISKASDIDALELTAGHLDVLINNAGVLLDPPVAFDVLPLDVIRKTFDTNFFGTIAITQKLLPTLQKAPKPVLAMISSHMASLGENTSGGSYAYRSSKAALNMITRSLAHDYPWLTALSLHPGWVQTHMGGAQAPTSVAASVKGLSKVIEEAKAKDSGTFLDFKGRVIAW